MDRWKNVARATIFRQDLLQIENRVGAGHTMLHSPSTLMPWIEAMRTTPPDRHFGALRGGWPSGKLPRFMTTKL